MRSAPDLAHHVLLAARDRELLIDAIEHDLCVMYAGHYATETLGVQALGAFLEARFGIPWTFLRLPTGS